MIMGTILIIIINILMIVLAAVIVVGKGDRLIAGYNTVSEQEKQQFNVKRLRVVVAAILVLSIVVLDAPFLIGGQADDATAGTETAQVIAGMAVVYIAIAGIIIANTWCKKK